MPNGVTSQDTGGSVPRPSRGLISFRQYNRLADAALGRGVSVIGQSTYGDPPQRTIAQINGHTADGTTNRFFYGYDEVFLSGRGYGKWMTVADGYTGDPDDENSRIYHYVENVNTDTGVTGSGVNVDRLPPGITVSAVPDGTLNRTRIASSAETRPMGRLC